MMTVSGKEGTMASKNGRKNTKTGANQTYSPIHR